MSPAHAKKRGGKRYRYYVSQAIVRREPREAGSMPRISAQAIEDLVTSRFLALLPPGARDGWQEIPPAEQIRQVHRTLRRVEMRAKEVGILFDKAAIDPQTLKYAGERLMGDLVASGRETLTVGIPVQLNRFVRILGQDDNPGPDLFRCHDGFRKSSDSWILEAYHIANISKAIGPGVRTPENGGPAQQTFKISGPSQTPAKNRCGHIQICRSYDTISHLRANFRSD